MRTIYAIRLSVFTWEYIRGQLGTNRSKGNRFRQAQTAHASIGYSGAHGRKPISVNDGLSNVRDTQNGWRYVFVGVPEHAVV